MDRRLISIADYHHAVANALRCWDLGEVDALPWVELASMAGVSQIAALFCHQGMASDSTASQDAHPRPRFLAAIIRIVSEEAGIPEAQAAAFFVRLFVDALATPAYQAAFMKLPAPVAEAIAIEWMQLAVSAWHAGWFPGLDGPAQAAAELSAGWPRLLMAAAAEGDVYTRYLVAVASGDEATAYPKPLGFASPTPRTALPRRSQSVAIHADVRAISDVGAFTHAMACLLDGSTMSPLARTVTQEMAAWLALQDMTTGILPAAVRMKIGLANGDAVISIFGDTAEASLFQPTATPPLFEASAMPAPASEAPEMAELLPQASGSAVQSSQVPEPIAPRASDAPLSIEPPLAAQAEASIAEPPLAQASLSDRGAEPHPSMEAALPIEAQSPVSPASIVPPPGAGRLPAPLPTSIQAAPVRTPPVARQPSASDAPQIDARRPPPAIHKAAPAPGGVRLVGLNAI